MTAVYNLKWMNNVFPKQHFSIPDTLDHDLIKVSFDCAPTRGSVCNKQRHVSSIFICLSWMWNNSVYCCHISHWVYVCVSGCICTCMCVCVCGLWRYTISSRLSVGCQSSPPHSWHINNSEMMQTRWGLTPSPGYKRSSSSTLIKIPSTYWHGKGEKCGRDLLQCCLD